MIKTSKFGDFKPTGKNEEKKQIVLCHSSRELDKYLNSLQYRFNGKFRRIPNFIVSKEGEVFELLTGDEYSDFFSEERLNENSIVIVLENLGWLQKEPLKDYYVNWIGDIYKGKVFERKWREHYFWDPYTEEQLEKVYELCKEISENMTIDFIFSGHNTKINGAEKIKGIVTKSNFSLNYTDLSPAFDFENFFVYIVI